MTHIEWQFGGWLRHWPAPVALALLAALGLAGVFYVFWFYRHTGKAIGLWPRRSLAGLRLAVIVLLLLCLANPVRVEQVAPPKSSVRSLTVLVDRSASMSTPDYRGITRLASAVRHWRQVEPVVTKSFGRISYRRFANDVQVETAFDSAVKAGNAGSETCLYAALKQALAENPSAIVCLTDGLDTSTNSASEFTAEAAQRGIPIYFVPGENHLTPGASLTLREVEAPARVLRQTQFTTTALMEAAVAKDQDLPVELWVNGKKTATAKLPVHAGRNTLSWPVRLDSGEPGPLTLEFRAAGQSASCAVDVVESAKMDVLYYQGALQWGYRFLRGALESDPSFRLTAILNPALEVHLAAASGDAPAITDLPEDAAELRRFQIVILAHVFAGQLTYKQQRALVDYVRGGGGVLFISPDSAATEGFSGSLLEQMLPVVFGRQNEGVAPALQRMRNQFAANAAQSGDDLQSGGSQNIVLLPFALPVGANCNSAVSRLFANANGDALPKYAINARVRAVKPGAEILAVSSEGASAVLLAKEQFGSGFTAALTTDLLWRWKMSLPGTSHAVEKFWQQLLLSLAPASGQGLRVVKATTAPTVNQSAVFSICGAATGGLPKVEAISPEGYGQLLTVTDAGSVDGPAWQASFIPAAIGEWKVRVTDAASHIASVTFPVVKKSNSTELLNLPTDFAGMKQLAESTGGSLLTDATTFQSPLEIAAKPPAKLPEPLWNTGLLLMALLAGYAAELILRRWWKLL